MAEPSGNAEARGEIVEARVTDLVIRLAFLGAFAYWSMELVRPFLPIVLWAVVLSTALYPVHLWLSARLGGRQRLSAALLTSLAFVVVVGPVGLLAASFVETTQILVRAMHAHTLTVPPPPPVLETWPLVGDPLHDAWELAATNFDEAIRQYGPVLLPAGETALGKVAALGGDVAMFVISVLIAGCLFLPGPRLVAGARRFAGRIMAPRGAHFVDLAGATIRNVSRGVIGVAVLQAILAGIVLKVAAVPGAGLLAFAILLLCILQIGPAVILLPVVVWAWMSLALWPALALSIALVPILLIDNVLKPILIARGLTTPTLVILTGVIGGTLAYGMIGLFLGPIVLAVFYELLLAWVALDPPVAAAGETRQE
ncbi:MAG: AI-2E family transporter [Amaricoccus sp.]